MSEWNHQNTSCTDDIVIRQRDTIELVEGLCISPLLQSFGRIILKWIITIKLMRIEIKHIVI